jgi:DNA-binding CsgD family transcriptional regulator/predicted negative regulator of RcsB-dependent stress response
VDGPPYIGLDAPAGPRVRASAARLALIERDEEWKLASQAIGLARAGAGSVLLFEGASGLGKSGLLSAVRALALESGAQILSAAGHRRESQFNFGVAMQLFESESSAERTSPIVQDLVRAAPSPEPSFAQIHTLYRACAELAAGSHVVLLIDDADFADEGSLRFLLYLTERVSELAIAVVLTAGTVAPRQAPPLLAEIARHPSTTSSRLEPLSASGTAHRVGKTSLSASAQGAVEEIHQASGGNPFIVDALANALAADEERNRLDEVTVRAAGLAVPGVGEWALVRAGDLDPEAPALLRAIAVLGPDCELRHACALAGRDVEGAGKILDLLAEVGILAPGEHLTFAQPAVGTAIELAQTSSERAASNLRAAHVLGDDGEPPERVAEHFVHATRMGSAAAVETLSLAASVSLGRADPFAAVRFLRRALEEPPPRELRASIVLELGRVEAMAGEPQAALRLADGLAQLTVGAQRPRQALVTGRTLFALGRPFEAMIAFDRGVDAAAEADADTAARLAAARATATWFTGVLKGASPALPPPPASADTAGDRALLALHALDGARRGIPATQVRELAERALARGALLEDETSDGLAYYLAPMALFFAGDLQLAEAALTAAVEDAQDRGSILGFATAAHLRSRTILRRGRLRDAALDARRAVAVERDGWRFGLGGARVVLAHRLIERGDLAGAQRHLDLAEAASVEAEPFHLSLLSARGRLMMYRGDAEGALDSFLACGALAERAGVSNPAVVGWRADAGLATAVTGDWAEAERLVEAELSLASEFGEPGAIGRALRALGSVRDPERALEALEAAVQVLGDSQAALDRAIALVDFGAALRRCGRRRDARAPLREGLELAERCGAEVLAARALREANVAGARPRRTALHGQDALTARERQVATLAADGLSNREIAEQLVVTVKTVEWHLKNSFVKLGVSSRTQLPGVLDGREAS